MLFWGQKKEGFTMSQNTVGERIKHHRKRLGLTQEQLAERLGVSAQAVSKWENNLSCPDISILPELADIFGISVDELLGKGETVHKAEPITQKPQSESHFNISWNFSGILFAVFVILFGGLWLMNDLCGFDVSWWTLLWTLWLCYLGISGLRNGISTVSLFMALAGLYFLLSAYKVIDLDISWSVLIPVCILLWGASLLLDIFRGKKKARKNPKKDETRYEYSCDDGYVHCDMSFGGNRTAVVTPLLRGGCIDTSFGNFVIDFSGCEDIAPDCCLDIDNSFGSLTLLVPNKFRVKLDGENSFGTSHCQDTPLDPPQAVLHLKFDNSFGTMSVKYI